MYMLLAVDPILEPAIEWLKANWQSAGLLGAAAYLLYFYRDRIGSLLKSATAKLSTTNDSIAGDARVQGYRVLIELVDADPPLTPEGRKACDTLAVELLDRRRAPTKPPATTPTT